MQMILKSMGVKVDKEEMDGYAAELDEEGSGADISLSYNFHFPRQLLLVV